MKKNFIVITILGVFLLVGCGSKTDSSYTESSRSEIAQDSLDMTNSNDYGEQSITKNIEESTESASVVSVENRKIINNAEIHLETTEFDNSLKVLQEMVDSLGGYIESSDIYQSGISDENYKDYRNANYVVRVPSEKFEDFLNKSSNIGVITNRRTFGQDISSQYYDSEARLKVLKAQEERYLAILSEATEISEIVELEKALTEVRYEIEMITGYLKSMDDLIDMSTVNVTINEVAETSKSEKVPVTIGEKITKAFSDSIKSLKVLATGTILLVVMIIPYIAILAIVSSAIYFIYKKIKIYKKPKE